MSVEQENQIKETEKEIEDFILAQKYGRRKFPVLQIEEVEEDEEILEGELV